MLNFICKADSTDAVKVYVFLGDKLKPAVDEKTLERLEKTRLTLGIKPEERHWHLVPSCQEEKGKYILLQLPLESVKDARLAAMEGFAVLLRGLKGLGIEKIEIVQPAECCQIFCARAVEGMELGAYSFDKYKTLRPGKPGVTAVVYPAADEATVKEAQAYAAGEMLSRDLANEPGNVIVPADMARIAQDVAAKGGLEVEVYDDRWIVEKGMNALYAVGKGSASKPRLAHLVYKPKGASRGRIVFVGKSVTFDSGGLSIKTGDYMCGMKGDKMGACNVLGIMQAVAVLQPDVEVHGVFGAAENMPDGNAYRVDDIIKAYNGKTIEVVNTDAEGRVTLADTLAWASELKPDLLIDMATLTGAIGVALGGYTAGAMGDCDKLGTMVVEKGAEMGERFHFFKLDDEKLKEQIMSTCADVKNSGGRGGGSLTAGMFLREFVAPGTPWLHLDIAGVDHNDKATGIYSAGASGFGVRTCLNIVKNFKKD